MRRWVPLVSVGAVCIAAAAVFQIKFKAETVAEDVAALQRQVDEEKERISSLKAEWSYLIQPDRVQALAESFYARLQLQPLEAEQIGGIEMLPERRAEIEPESRARLNELLLSNENPETLFAPGEGEE